MIPIKRGTPAFGIITGLLFVSAGVLFMTIGFWKTLLIAVLFGLGYFIGAISNKEKFIKETVNRVIPEKKNNTIQIRDEILQEQETAQENVKKENGD